MSNHLDYEINKELGECYLFMGELEKAEDYYQKAIGSNGVHPEPYLGLATIAVQKGDLEIAMDHYQKAAEIEKSDKAYAGMGLIEIEKGDHHRAFDHMTQALDSNPENLIALLGLVQSGHVIERLEEIVPYMKTYLELDGSNLDVRYSLAGCLASLGNKEEAQAEIEAILAAEPEHQAAQELLTQL